MKQTIQIVIATLVFFFGIASAETSTDSNHPTAKLLEGLYLRYLEAGSRGDMAAYLHTRTAEMTKRIASQLTSEMLKRMAKHDLHPKESQFVRVDSSKKVSRIIYQKLGPDKSEWQAVMFHEENGEWKIGRIIGVLHGGNRPKHANGLEELLNHPDVEIPEN